MNNKILNHLPARNWCRHLQLNATAPENQENMASETTCQTLRVGDEWRWSSGKQSLLTKRSSSHS